MNGEEIISRLKALRNPENIEGMARYGINPRKALGIPIPVLRTMAKEVGRDHNLALELWDSGFREARILATLIDDPKQVTDDQMERWVLDFDSWDVCDGCISNLFQEVHTAWDKAIEWVKRPEPFVKRAGFVLMARLAVSDKKAPNDRFLAFLPLITQEASDGRNFVKKAISWALRQIGKRDPTLADHAIKTAEQLARHDSKSARWIAADALKDLAGKKSRRPT